MFWKLLSQAKAVGVLQAIDGTDGTVKAAVSEGNCSSKIDR